jgi:hypothetical protein
MPRKKLPEDGRRMTVEKAARLQSMLTRRSALLLPAALSAGAGDLEVFVLAGQSNMAGRGAVDADSAREIPGVLAWDRESRWGPARDPLHWDKPEIAGVGLGQNFANVLAEGKRTIGLVPCAFGGSALWEWMPGEKHYDEAVRRTRAALAAGGRVAGVLWHQGEADAGDETRARTYGERWLRFVNAIRKDLNTPDLPVVVGELGRFFRAPHVEEIKTQLACLPLRASRVGFVPSEGLSHKGDEVHFDAASLREFGRRYAHAWRMLSW